MPLPKRDLTPAQIIALIRQLTPAQIAVVTLFLLVENRADRDEIIAKLRQIAS
jgi:hypothetical protein